MSSFDVTSPVVRELRAARPRAPEQLRERVTALSACPQPRPRFSFSMPARYTVRRVAFVAAPAVIAVAVGGAVIHGIANSGAPTVHPTNVREAPKTSTVPVYDTATKFGPAIPYGAQTLRSTKALSDTGERALVPQRTALPPSKTRLQDYRAAMTVRVDGLDQLSPATQKAMRIARLLGGYVVSAQFNAAKQGNSSLVFRIPVNRVQQAIARFSALGTIAAQDIRITDLQAQYNQLVRRIGALRVAIAKVDDRLADPSLSNEDRVRLEQRRARLAATLDSVRTSKARTSHRASLATVSLALTTREAVVPVKPHHRGPLGRALHDVGTILAKEASWALYALIVLGPIAVIAFLAFLLVRVGRRVSDRRLLESS
jgi:hypothetical protein